MLKIRLLRRGKKGQPFFKIVVVEKHRAPKTGRFVEELGYFDPITKKLNLKRERIQYWLRVGAKMSQTVRNLLKK